MDTAAELERNPVSKHQIQPEYGDEQVLTRNGTAPDSAKAEGSSIVDEPGEG